MSKGAQYLGRILGGAAGRIEPTTGSLSTALTGGSIGDKVTKFQETDWFNNLPKEKKNAIEKALKGEK
jgi:phage tail tape-measure protein